MSDTGGTTGLTKVVTLQDIYEEAAYEVLTNHSIDDLSNAELNSRVYAQTKTRIERYNALKAPGIRKFIDPLDTHYSQVVLMMLHRYRVIHIQEGDLSSEDKDLLAVYQTEGDHRGIYLTGEGAIEDLLLDFNMGLTLTELRNAMRLVRKMVPHIRVNDDRDLVALNNGIFNYQTKELLEFDPEIILKSKSRVNFNEITTLPILQGPQGEVFDFDKWLLDLFDDDSELAELIYQVMGAILRNKVSWHKGIFFYSEVGNNGKGTLVELLRNLVGQGSWMSLSLDRMGQDFMLESLPRVSAIITDENDVGYFIDKAANVKALITGDALTVNRKGLRAVTTRFEGLMVQCLNELPRVKDKTGSFLRRLLFIPFAKTFTGKEKKWIKEEMMSNTELLEALVYKVLVQLPTYYELDPGLKSLEVLEEFEIANNPVKDFWEEMKGQFVWDLVPNGFLYDLFKSWFRQMNPSGVVLSNQVFQKGLRNILLTDDLWVDKTQVSPSWTGTAMDAPEFLISEYDLSNWKNPTYQGSDISKVCTPVKKPSYRGIVRH